MYHHVKKLMFTVRVDEPDPASETCCWNSLAAPTANSLPPCSIRFRIELRRSGSQGSADGYWDRRTQPS